MQSVITEAEARKITGGRKPLMPVEYEKAVTALGACMKIDETKYWADKADALAAWARIYRNDEAGIEARRLKLHAYRRMGELAAQCRPFVRKPNSSGSLRFANGPRSLLKEHGLNEDKAAAAMITSRLPKIEFDAIIARPRPPSPETLRRTYGTPEWSPIRQAAWSLRSQFKKHKAAELARSLDEREIGPALSLVRDLTEWLDEFEQHLPKK